jgi:acetyl esterase/lipase
MSPRMRTGIEYAPADPPGSRGHTLDLYLPDGPGPWPLLIACGGSAFLDDGGSYYAAELAPWSTEAGFAVAGVCIRSSGQARFPAQVHDVKAALRWLRAHAAEHDLDAGRFAVMGDSSGGWTAAVAGLTADRPELEGLIGETGGSSRVQAVVDLYGPTDFLQMDVHMLPGACASFNELMGLTDCHDDPASPESRLMGFPIQSRPDDVRAANPCTYASADAPPFLIAHGQLDALVPHHQSEVLYAALAAAGAEATFFSVPEVGHNKGIVSPAVPEAVVRSTSTRGTEKEIRPTLDAIERFLRAALG